MYAVSQQPVSNKYKPRLGSLGRQLSDATYVTHVIRIMM